MIEQLLEFNKQFVEQKQYEQFITTKYPSKKIAILSCMDTRLTGLLPAALGFKNGDVKVIKNAGALISSPFGSVMRSLMVAIYVLDVTDILVIGHYDCGMQCLDCEKIISKMRDKGISDETFELIKNCGIDLDKWLTGFGDMDESVNSTVKIIKNHPLIPKSINVFGMIMDPTTGEVECISDNHS